MTLQELYQIIQGDYQDVKMRLRSEERIQKFLIFFLKDESFSIFMKGMEEEDYETAFRGIHTLKGVCMNLGLHTLKEQASFMTELLREHHIEETKAQIETLQQVYDLHCAAICQLQQN